MGGYFDAFRSGANWLMDAPILKPFSDWLRKDEENKRLARGAIPGYSGLEALTGGISGIGSLIGMGLDRGPGGISELDQNDVLDILTREYGEGIHSGIEQVAPIDVASIGLPIAGGLAKSAKIGKALTRAGDIADISEGLYGVGQVGHGIHEGALDEIGVGLARMAGGAGGALGGFGVGRGAPDVPTRNPLAQTQDEILEELGRTSTTAEGGSNQGNAFVQGMLDELMESGALKTAI
jgi:hypothetical protein